MTPLAQAAIVLCVVAVSAALVVLLLAGRRAVLRLESVLAQVEHELPPLVRHVESLSTDIRKLLNGVNDELAHVSVVVRRADDVTAKLARIVGVAAALTSLGQYAHVAAGLKKGAVVFVRRLRDTR